MIVKFIEIDLNKTQTEKFYRDRANVRFIWNEYLAYIIFRFNAVKEGWIPNDNLPNFINNKKFMVFFNNIYLKFNPHLKFVKETSTMAIQKSVENACKAFTQFFEGKKGFPKFKSKKRDYELGVYYIHTGTKVRREGWYCKGNRFFIPTLGEVKLKEKGYLLEIDQIRSVTIKEYGNRFYIAVLIESPEVKPTTIKDNRKEISELLNDMDEKILGIDLGVKTYATCSNGKKYNFPKKKIYKLKKKIKRLQRKRSRSYLKNKHNKEWRKKNVEKINKQQRILEWKKKLLILGFIQNIIDDMVRAKPKSIVMEDLKISNLKRNKHIAYLIQDLDWYGFKVRMVNKCNRLQIPLYLANTFFPSSKRCCMCGSKKDNLKLKDRTYICSSCGTVIDRDYNATINLSLIPLGITGIQA